MSLHVAFLRGINLGNRRLSMDELAGHFEELGLEEASTYLASGNVVFQHDGAGLDALEREIEAHLADALGYEVDTFVRSLDELRELLALERIAEAEEEGLTPYVSFLRSEPGEEVREALDALETPDDLFHLHSRHLFWLRRGRQTDSDIEPRDRERALGGADNTQRKLNTVRRIVKKLGELSGG